MKRLTALVVVLAALFVACAAVVTADPGTEHPPHARPADSGRVLLAAAPVAVHGAPDGLGEVHTAFDAFVAGVAEAEWYAGVQAELDRQAALEAARQRRASSGSSVRAPVDGDLLDRLAHCECGGNPSCDTGNGYFGTFQFLPSTWRGIGGEGMPHEASYEEQKARAAALIERSGWGQFPGCAAKLGVR